MRRIALAMVLVFGGFLLSGCLNPQAEEPLRAVITTDPNPPRGDPPLTVQFSAAGSTGDIDEYIWDFGDGDSARGRIVHHTYSLPGNYDVVLRVVGPDGERSAQVKVHVNSAPPVVEYLQADRSIVHATHTVYFYASAYDPDADGEVRFFHWNFGNGETAVTPTGDIAYIYEEPGKFTVTVWAEDDNGDLSEPATLQLEVLPPCPCD